MGHWNTLRTLAGSLVLLSLLWGCGPGSEPEEWYRNCSEPGGAVQVSIEPGAWTMPVGSWVQFRATVEGSDEPVTWWVDGIEGGGPGLGTISEFGNYHAPPDPVGVWVTATVGSDTTACATAVLYAIPEEPVLGSPTLRYHRFIPRVIAPDRTEPVGIEVTVNGYASGVQVRWDGRDTLLQATRPDVYRGEIPASLVLSGYQPNFVLQEGGIIRLWRDFVMGETTNIKIPVRTAAMPSPTVLSSDETSQTTAHIFNVYGGPIWDEGLVPGWPLERFYAEHPDSFDFIAMVPQVIVRGNRGHTQVRNDVSGIGLPLIDRAAELGYPAAGASLQGTIKFPMETMFDLAERGAVHEIGHQWMVGWVWPLGAEGSHWRISTTAYGMMGINNGESMQGVDFPWTLSINADEQVYATHRGASFTFNSVELYLMGLHQPLDSEPHFFVAGATAPDFYDGPLEGTPTRTTFGELFEFERSPAVGAVTSFRLATIVLSWHGALLNDDELAWFDYMAARGESATAVDRLPGQPNAYSRTNYLPFGPATNNLGSLSTTIATGP